MLKSDLHRFGFENYALMDDLLHDLREYLSPVRRDWGLSYCNLCGFAGCDVIG